MDEVPIFKRLTAGRVDDDIGLYFLLEKVADGGNITRLGAALPTVVGIQTGMRPHVIACL